MSADKKKIVPSKRFTARKGILKIYLKRTFAIFLFYFTNDQSCSEFSQETHMLANERLACEGIGKEICY